MEIRDKVKRIAVRMFQPLLSHGFAGRRKPRPRRRGQVAHT